MFGDRIWYAIKDLLICDGLMEIYIFLPRDAAS